MYAAVPITAPGLDVDGDAAAMPEAELMWS
jgi:hypothetical protein